MRVAAILGFPINLVSHGSAHFSEPTDTDFTFNRQRLGPEGEGGDHLAFWNQSDGDAETSLARALEGRLYFGCIRLPPFKDVGRPEYIYLVPTSQSKSSALKVRCF
jgi:hypothetical protein